VDDNNVFDYCVILCSVFITSNYIKTYMMIVSNIEQYPELKIDEQHLKKCIRKHYSTINAPIFIYIDKRLHQAHGLHRCVSYKEYKRLPSVISENILSDIKKNKNHFHKVSLSYGHLSEAKNSSVKKTRELNTWPFPQWPRTHRFFHSYLLTLLSHELQHARQKEHGIQYKRHNWMEYDEKIFDKTEVEYDACMAEFKKAPKLLRSYCNV